MKKYFYILTAAVLLLSGCDENSSRQFMEYDPPRLTTMTTTIYIPEDTYSQYMETYTSTESETTNSDRYYRFRGANGVGADTMATVPTVGKVQGITADTPMTTTTTAPPETESETGSGSAETSATETPEDDEVTETVTATVQTMEPIPADDTTVPDTLSETSSASAISTADTPFSNNVTAYTGTVQKPERDTIYKNTSNGGTDNAN